MTQRSKGFALSIAVDLDPIFSNYDTLAHLLYRLRFFSEAMAAAPYEQEREKIKKHTCELPTYKKTNIKLRPC